MSDEIIRLSDLFKEEEKPTHGIQIVADPNIKHDGFELRHYSSQGLVYPGAAIPVDDPNDAIKDKLIPHPDSKMSPEIVRYIFYKRGYTYSYNLGSWGKRSLGVLTSYLNTEIDSDPLGVAKKEGITRTEFYDTISIYPDVTQALMDKWLEDYNILVEFDE